MYEDSYAMVFQDRAYGQSIPSNNPKVYPFEKPYDFFDNRMVGQVPSTMKNPQTAFDISRNPAFSTVFPPPNPMDNVIQPTTIYGTVFAGGGYDKMKIFIGIGVALVVVLLLIGLLKKNKE